MGLYKRKEQMVIEFCAVFFSSSVSLVSNLTQDIKALMSCAYSHKRKKGSTKTDEGLRGAANVLSTANPSSQKHIILITDGKPDKLELANKEASNLRLQVKRQIFF